VWNYHCLQNEVPVGFDWINDVKDYEATILETR
ncbi:L-rhamnose isomerase, partial [Vibrio parahaemolyticus]